MTKQAIGYVRVSTEQQASEGVSLEAQAARIRAYATLNELDLAAIYTDAGLSGKRSDNRPQLQAALDHATRIGGVLVVYSLSRLARSTRDTLAIAERLEKGNADLASLSEKIDTTTAAGKMVFRMLAVLAEFERDQISERTTTAMRHKKNNGERVGQIPYGFDLAADGVTLEANAAEQSVIALVKQLQAAGESVRKIAAELTRRGVVNKSGTTTWHATMVQRLKNRKAA